MIQSKMTDNTWSSGRWYQQEERYEPEPEIDIKAEDDPEESQSEMSTVSQAAADRSVRKSQRTMTEGSPLHLGHNMTPST